MKDALNRKISFVILMLSCNQVSEAQRFEVITNANLFSSIKYVQVLPDSIVRVFVEGHDGDLYLENQYYIIEYQPDSNGAIRISSKEIGHDIAVLAQENGEVVLGLNKVDCDWSSMRIAKLDDQGSIMWYQEIGNPPSGEDVLAITSDPLGVLYVTTSESTYYLDENGLPEDTLYFTHGYNTLHTFGSGFLGSFQNEIDEIDEFLSPFPVQQFSDSIIQFEKLEGVGYLVVTGKGIYLLDLNLDDLYYNENIIGTRHVIRHKADFWTVAEDSIFMLDEELQIDTSYAIPHFLEARYLSSAGDSIIFWMEYDGIDHRDIVMSVQHPDKIDFRLENDLRMQTIIPGPIHKKHTAQCMFGYILEFEPIHVEVNNLSSDNIFFRAFNRI